jgi:hypothetical protein
MRPYRSTCALLAAALLMPGLAAAGLDDNPTAQLLKFLFRPFAEQAKANEAVRQFKEKTRNALVIYNQSAGTWKFGLVDGMADELKDTPSGSVTVAYVSSVREIGKAAAMAPGAAPATVSGPHGAIVVTPVREGRLWYSNFARVAYLEDDKGRRVYLTLTENPAGQLAPVVGVTRTSHALVMNQQLVEFSDREMKDLSAIGILRDRLAGE